MTSQNSAARPTGRIRSPQNVAGGIVLILLAVSAIWLTIDLPRGTLNSVGPAMLPQAIAALIGVCGIALLISGLTKPSDYEEAIWTLRGPLLVTCSIVIFALTIKPMHFGNLDTPELGLVISGPLAIIIGGYASPEAKLRDLVLLALALTPFCMVLFGDMLNLPIPILPRFVGQNLLVGISYKTALRVTAAVMFGAAVILYLTTRGISTPVQVAKRDEVK